MARRKSPLLRVSTDRKNLDRCWEAIAWVSRRLSREEVTQGRVFATGRGADAKWYLEGEPLISLPVINTIRQTGLNGVSANTEAAHKLVRDQWSELDRQWREVTQANVKDLIIRTNAWIDATLHVDERRRLQGYLRQRRHAKVQIPKYVPLRIRKELYDQIAHGIPPDKTKEFFAFMLEWFLAEGKPIAMNRLGLSTD